MSERLVIVGNGMAATRLVEMLVARRYDGHITVIGEEPVPAYNRILLSAVLEGTHRAEALTMRDPEWFASVGVDLRLGSRVLQVSRKESDVMLVDGTTIPWDRLVLATGAIPTLPPIRGLVQMDGQLHPKVHAFRSLADCNGLLSALAEREGQRAVVVGGGLLGLQVARALSVRGVATEIVEGTEHLLSTQLDERGGSILKRGLKKLGTEVYTGARAVRLTDEGLKLDNGYTLETDLVILTAGGRPSTALARQAELYVRRGIVVDGHLASITDPRVHAVGDCAEFAGKVTGFVPPAWEQAVVLAEHLCGGDVAYDGSRSVARLRASDLEVAVLGDPEHTDGEVVEVTNPIAGTHRKLVVRGGVIVAAALVGDLARVGLITQLYDRRTILGAHEPGELLSAERATASEATELPDDAEVCACAGVSAGRIRGCRTLDEVRGSTRATTGCGGCSSVVEQLLAR
ncbi:MULTISPECIES: FAD-dependent oxidoreductase [unclassified Nocardioides]|uniref:FAD-dependent oxidoreductase n=1 Tax=unclassified Nocardioides TaxID=2615069 RepID=UPI0006FAEDBE|nr:MULTISPECIES: FAD-dependent oxidoreductase [unclassified Nocardioides]KQY55390.1 nitrite reductase [Nocardioides sp. Root140]KQZ75502.1 nitrite reductase [Nocardioides sp. Root151]KRF14578.1 nitrite reductase [Nocardioides sp. Soil796]